MYVADAGCGELEYVAPQGDIYSPGWPGSYPMDLDCSYQVSIGNDSIDSISLSLVVLDIEYHSSCDFDYVQVSKILLNFRTVESVHW